MVGEVAEHPTKHNPIAPESSNIEIRLCIIRLPSSPDTSHRITAAQHQAFTAVKGCKFRVTIRYRQNNR